MQFYYRWLNPAGLKIFLECSSIVPTPTPTPSRDDCYNDSPSTYSGTKSKTISFRTCQNWNKNSPHRTKHQAGNHNYCRAPGIFSSFFIRGCPKTTIKIKIGDTRTWCYTTDPNKRWEYCDVPQCHTETGPTDPTPDIGQKCGIPTFEPFADENELAKPSVVTIIG